MYISVSIEYMLFIVYIVVKGKRDNQNDPEAHCGSGFVIRREEH